MTNVIRRPWPSDPRYSIGSDGSIRGPRGSVLKAWRVRGGYSQVEVGGGRRVKVHVLVCEAFHGMRPVGMEVAHGNGDPADNRAANLSWKTRAANHADKLRHGTAQRGENHGGHRLTANDVQVIREAAGRGETLRSLASRFGVTATAVGYIVRRKTWRHI